MLQEGSQRRGDGVSCSSLCDTCRLVPASAWRRVQLTAAFVQVVQRPYGVSGEAHWLTALGSERIGPVRVLRRSVDLYGAH